MAFLKPFRTNNGISPEQLPMLSVLLAAGCLTSITGGAIAPVFPDIVEALNLNPRWAGILVSMPRLTVAIANPLLGFVPDRVGKLTVLLPSLIAFACFGIMGAFSQNLLSLLILRALVGVANGGISAASLGFVAHLFEGETRSRLMGYTASVITIASIIVPLLAGWLGSFHWRFAFCLYGFALPVAIAAWWLIKPPSNPKTDSGQKVSLKPLSQAFGDVRLGIVLLTLYGAATIFYTVLVYAPLYFQTAIGADSLLNGMILAARAIGAAIIAAVGAARVAKRLGKTKATGLGLVIMATTVAVIPVLNTPQSALITAFGFGLGLGLVMPNAYDTLADLAPTAGRSTLLALGAGTASLGQFLSPILLGAVWESGTHHVFFVASAIAIALAILQFIYPTYSQRTH